MFRSWTIAITGALLLASVCGWIQLKQDDEDKSLSPTTTELLSSFNQCIVFIFDWGVQNNNSDHLTSTYYFIFYSKSIRCSIIVETIVAYRNKRVGNPRFNNYHPHPLFTKYTTTLINLYSSAATGSRPEEESATDYIHFVIGKYNIPFNYVLLFMSNQVFTSDDLRTMFSECADVSAPAVYLLILDESEVYVVGFGHVLQSVPYLFKVNNNNFRDAHIQRLHEMAHKDLQYSKVNIYAALTPQKCVFGSQILLPGGVRPNDCAFAALLEYHNLTSCNAFMFSCPGYQLSYMKTYADPDTSEACTRKYSIYYEFINYLVAKYESSFICVVETGPMGFMAFVQAFDLPSWIIVAAVCTCLSLTVACSSTKIAAPFPTKMLASAVVVMMLLFDRFYASNNKKKKGGLERAAARQAAVLLIALWAFGAMLLGMSYSGKMVSELTAPSIPPLPQNMHELALAGYPIWTHKFRTFQENGNNVHIADLEYTIHDYFWKNQDKNPGLTNDLRRLSKAITVMRSDTTLQYQPSGRTSSNVLFVYADVSEEMKAVQLWAVMTSRRLRALNGGKLPFFNTFHQMIVQSNSLLPIFRKFFARLCEPGQLKYWDNIYRAESASILIWNGLLRSKRISMENQTFLVKALKRRINLATIWRHLDPLIASSDSWYQITLDTLSPAFQLYAISLLISAAVLVHERWPFQAVLRRQG